MFSQSSTKLSTLSFILKCKRPEAIASGASEREDTDGQADRFAERGRLAQKRRQKPLLVQRRLEFERNR